MDLFDSISAGSKRQPENYLVAHTDGGSRGNPGPAGYGVVIHDQHGKKVASLSEYLGRQTNNFAEYQALIAALEFAVEHGPRSLKVISDSELMVLQIKGRYKVRDAVLRDLHARARQLISQLVWFSIEHTLRGGNREADRLANEAMDKGSGKGAGEETNNHPGKSGTLVSANSPRELNGIVRNGRIELLDGKLPDGTQVQVRIKRP